MKPHKHAALIKKWADGAIIQRALCTGEWVDCKDNKPEWNNTTAYRVKPREFEIGSYYPSIIFGDKVVTRYCGLRGFKIDGRLGHYDANHFSWIGEALGQDLWRSK